MLVVTSDTARMHWAAGVMMLMAVLSVVGAVGTT